MTDETSENPLSPISGSTDELEGLRVLYAEDHPEMQKAMRRLLTVSGASVTVARNGLEATDLALAESFDLVLMDLRMPRMDGFDAARALRAAGYRVPLVAVTADDTPVVKSNAIAAGFDAVLPKPFELSDLVAALNIARARRRSGAP